MERRNHARVAVNLKAALLDEQAMPTGCRVRDVSKGGMLLQREHHGNATTFHEGDAVKVRLSLRQADESKIIPLSTTITRVEENSIGVEFVQPQSQLMGLVEPYRLDRENVQDMAAHQGREELAAGSAASPVSASTSARARRRRFAIQRARAQFAETMDSIREPVTEKISPVVEQSAGGNSITGKGDRRLFYVGLLSLFIAASMLLLDFGNRTSLENRMGTLESLIDGQVSALAMLRTRLTPADVNANELSALNTRVESLAASFAALETRIMQDATPTSAPTATGNTSDPQPAAGTPASDTLAKLTTPTKPQLQNTATDGTWVLNLVSLYNQAAANRFTEKARAKGIQADTNQFSVNGQQVWRVQVGGFPTRDEASAYGETSREKLGLTRVWIFKK